MENIKKAIVVICLILVIFTPIHCHAFSDDLYVPIGGLLYESPNADVFRVSKVVEDYQLAPECVINFLTLNGIKIYLDNENDVPESKKYSGIASSPAINITYETTPEGEMHIISQEQISNAYIDIFCTSRETANNSTLLHEMGHAVNFLYNGGRIATGTDYNISGTPEWEALYVLHKNIIATFGPYSHLNVYNSDEAFAEAFSYVLLEPLMVLEQAPEVYSYITGIINSLSAYGSTDIPRVLLAQQEYIKTTAQPEAIEEITEETPEEVEYTSTEIIEENEPEPQQTVKEYKTEPRITEEKVRPLLLKIPGEKPIQREHVEPIDKTEQILIRIVDILFLLIGFSCFVLLSVIRRNKEEQKYWEWFNNFDIENYI